VTYAANVEYIELLLFDMGDHRVSLADHHIAVVTRKFDNILLRNLEALQRAIQYI